MRTVQEVDETIVGEAAAASAKPVAGETFKDSESTRLLCASAYLDREFRDLVIKHCIDNRHRALGVCFGLDMPTVVRHCRRAKRMLDRRGLWLLLPGIVALVVAANLAGSAPDQLVDSPQFGQSVIILALLGLVSFAICYYFDSRARSIVIKNFLRGNFKPDAGIERDNTDVGYLQEAESGNTLIYSGFTPFVGSGQNMEAWSFALDLRKRANDAKDPSRNGNDLSPAEIESISLESLYDCVGSEIEKLDLKQVRVQDKLYVNGRDIRNDKRFLADPLSRPQYKVDESVVKNAMLEQGEKHLRHYRCVRVVDWDGELVLSIFLRFSKLRHNLFVEASYYLLTPVAERFRKVDSMSPRFKFGRFFNELLVSAFKTPFLTLWAPLGLVARVFEAIQHWGARREEDELILENPSFDYGAAFSFRQWASPNEYRRYFQRLDKEKYLKILEKNILDSVIAFLEQHEIDVSEIKQRQTMILNNGVMVSNGNLNASNVAAGTGAKIENMTQNVTQKVAQLAAKSAAPPSQAG